MTQNEIKEIIFQSFPGLKNDRNFKITSPEDPKYNCIAWAAIKNNVWLWPTNGNLDALIWPKSIPRNTEVLSFKLLFESYGYELCTEWKYEHHFQKVGFYVDKKNQITHGTRQTINGHWTSKLGSGWDIEHNNPFSIEGDEYGKVIFFMKRANISFDLNKIKHI